MAKLERPETEETFVLRSRGAGEPQQAAFDLVIASGPDAGARFAIEADAPRVFLGTSPACELRVTDRAVSRRHLAIEIRDGKLLVEDAGSRNGTLVGSLAIGRAMLEGGEVVRIGDTAIETKRRTTAARGVTTRTGFGRLLGKSSEMQRIYPLCEKLAASDVPVVLEGETGTGKEVLAEALHETGPRQGGPFVVFDCTAVPPSLVESELFGHERGAFTGAVATRKGVFEEAHGGTLLIDEIGDLAPDLQPKLLRALERREVRRIGGNKWIEVDVRVLAATRRDLDAEVAAGRFRDDLFHRLAVARIELPPLRARRGDVRVLVERFCSEMRGDRRLLDDALLDAWDAEAWPGNVRELRNAVARRLALGEIEEEADPDDAQTIPKHGAPVHETEDDLVARVLSLGLPLVQARERLVREFEARYVAHVLAQHGGNVTRAAEASGVARRHFQRVKKRAGE
ncbi:MAG TPA: sigma 54-interacting transcriptional regulator [Labilithrix sp.]